MDTLRLLENTDLDIFQEVRSLLLSSFDVKCHHTTESSHLFLCQFVLWMRWQTFIEKMLLQIKNINILANKTISEDVSSCDTYLGESLSRHKDEFLGTWQQPIHFSCVPSF